MPSRSVKWSTFEINIQLKMMLIRCQPQWAKLLPPLDDQKIFTNFIFTVFITFFFDNKQAGALTFELSSGAISS